MTPLDSHKNSVPGPTALAIAEVTSAARVATGTSTPFDSSGIETLQALLTITASSGSSPTMDLSLETSVDGGTSYDAVGQFTHQTGGAATDEHLFGPLGDLSRWRWTLGGGTPSFTFKIDQAKERR